MEHDTHDYLITHLLHAVPEMWPRWVTLTDDLGDDFSLALILEELADLLAPMLADPPPHAKLLDRAFEALDLIAEDGDEGEAAVAYGFLDTLPPDVLPAALVWMGPRVAAILAALEDGSFDTDSELAPE